MIDLLLAVHEKGAVFRFRASGESMFPTIRNGDIITVSSPDGVHAVPGDIVAFRTPLGGKLAVHRVTGVRSGSFLIKGDNSLEPDGTIPRSDILGLVTRIERGGRPIFWPDRRKWPKGAVLYSRITYMSAMMRRKVSRVILYLQGLFPR